MKPKTKIRKGDIVEVVTGPRNDKGRRGEVIRVTPKDKRVVIQKINMRKKHQRQFQTSKGRQMEAGIIEMEGSMDISNVMLVCPKCDEPTRVGTVRDEKGLAHRVCKKCESQID